MKRWFEEDVISNAGVLIGIVDIQGNTILFNKKAEEVTGYSAKEVLGKPWVDIFLKGEEKARHIELMKKSMANGDTQSNTEVNVQTKADGIRVISFNSTILRDDKGNPKGIMAVGIDITEQKKANDILRDSEKRFRTIIENATDVILIIDGEGIIQYASPSIATVWSFPSEEVEGNSVIDYINDYLDPEDLERIIDIFASVLKGKERISTETRFRNIDGTWHFVEAITANHMDDPNINGVVITLRDITERKEMEKRLMGEKEQKYLEAFERAYDGVAIINGGKVVYANSKLLDIVGFSREELLESPFTDFLSGEDKEKVAEMYKKRMSGEDIPNIYTISFKHKNGSSRKVEINAGLTEYDGKIADLAFVREIPGEEN